MIYGNQRALLVGGLDHVVVVSLTESATDLQIYQPLTRDFRHTLIWHDNRMASELTMIEHVRHFILRLLPCYLKTSDA